MGPRVKFDPTETQKGDRTYPMVVIGNFIDYRAFSEMAIQKWVCNKWLFHGEIRVEKVNDLFFFHCSNIVDRDNLVDLETANYQGALLVLKPWFPGAAFANIPFDHASIWVRIEGIPLTSNEIPTASRALKSMLKTLYFDADSKKEGPKKFLRARMSVPLKSPLILGFYFEDESDRIHWVDFRYEGVFEYCPTCGLIGHKRARCKATLTEIHNSLSEVLNKICVASEIFVSEEEFIPLFTNKLIGLKRIERLRTSFVNLVHYERIRRPDEEGDSESESSSSDGASHSSNNADSPPRPPRRSNGGGCSKRKRFGPNSDDDSDEPLQKRPLWERRGIRFPGALPPTSIKPPACQHQSHANNGRKRKHCSAIAHQNVFVRLRKKLKSSGSGPTYQVQM